MIPITNQCVANLAGVPYNTEQIRRGPFVYSRTHEVVKQFRELATFGPCILLTSFSDASVTPQMAHRLPQNVRRWYSTNADVRDPRVRPLPIGIRLSHQVEAQYIVHSLAGHKRDVNLCYLNCMRNIPRTPNPREGLYEFFGGEPWITVKGGFDHVPIEIFYADLQTHTFTLSPPGAGLDCHRHWEAIALGCIPVMLRSTVTELLFADMPALIVDDWAEVTRQRLEYEYPILRKRFDDPCMNKLDWSFWKAIIEGDTQ